MFFVEVCKILEKELKADLSIALYVCEVAAKQAPITGNADNIL